MNFTMIEPLYAFGWYLRCILVCYLIFYFTCKFAKNRTARLIVTIICFVGWFIIRSTILIDSTPFLQARQMLAFPLGVILAEIPEIRLKISGWGYPITFGCIVLGTVVYGFLHMGILTIDYLFLYNTISLFTCVLCAIGFMCLVYQCRFLQNFGIIKVATISYEIYLTHGYTINYVTKNTFCGMLQFLLFTILLSIVLHLLTGVTGQVKSKTL